MFDNNNLIANNRKIIDQRIQSLQKRINSKIIKASIKSPQKKQIKLSHQHKFNLTIKPQKKQTQIVENQIENFQKIIQYIIQSRKITQQEINQARNIVIQNNKKQPKLSIGSSRQKNSIFIDQNYQQLHNFQTHQIRSRNSMNECTSPVNLTKRIGLTQQKDFQNLPLKKDYSLQIDQDFNPLQQFAKYSQPNESQTLREKQNQYHYKKMHKRTVQNKQMNQFFKSPTKKKYQNIKTENLNIDITQLKSNSKAYSEMFFQISQSLSPRNHTIYDQLSRKTQNLQSITIRQQTRAIIAQKIKNQLYISEKNNREQSIKNQKYQYNHIIHLHDLQKKTRDGLLEKINLMRQINN